MLELSRIGAGEGLIKRKLKDGGCDSLGILQYPRRVRDHLNHVILNALEGGNEACSGQDLSSCTVGNEHASHSWVTR